MPVERDLAFVAASEVRAADIVKAALSADRGLIAAAQVFDVYEGQGVPSGHKSVAIAVTLQPRERSLTDAEIDLIVNRIVAEVARKTGAALRVRDGATSGRRRISRAKARLRRSGRADRRAGRRAGLFGLRQDRKPVRL